MTKFVKNSALFVCSMLFLVAFTICNKNAVTPSKDPIPIVTPPKDTTHHVIWGSSSKSFPGEKGVDGVEAWNRLNDKVKSLNGNHGLQAHRTYDSGFPASFAASAMAPDLNLCPVSAYSFQPPYKETADGSKYTAIKQFVQSIPSTHEVYLVFHHEPEYQIFHQEPGGPAPGWGDLSPDLLQTAFSKFVEAVLDAGKPNVHPCFVLMSWTFDSHSGRNPNDFNLGAKLNSEQKSKVIAGMDGYADLPTGSSAKSIFETSFAKMATWGYTRFGIFETATHPVDTKPLRADWITALGVWVNSRTDIELVCWWNSIVGEPAGEKGWFLGQWTVNPDGTFNWTDADGSVAAYAQLLK